MCIFRIKENRQLSKEHGWGLNDQPCLLYTFECLELESIKNLGVKNQPSRLFDKNNVHVIQLFVYGGSVSSFGLSCVGCAPGKLRGLFSCIDLNS